MCIRDRKEETAATLWMKIEEKAEINQEEPEEDKSSFGSYLYSLMKVVLTVFVLILTVAVLFRGCLLYTSRCV